MRILYLNHNVAWSGGTFFRALPFACELASRGHDVTLLTISPRNRMGIVRTEHRGVTVIETPDLLWGRGRTGWDPWDVLHRMRFVSREDRWDVIHSWDCRPVAILPALWARRRSSPRSCLVTDWADWWGRGGTQSERQGAWMQAFWPVETFFEESFRTAADGTTTISKALRDRVVGLGVAPDRTCVIPQGCDPPDARSRADARVRLGLDADRKVAIYLGRLNKSDGDLLFPTVDALLASGRDLQFVMVGNHGSRFPERLLSDKRFSVTGPVSEAVLHDYIAACDISLAPLADTLASRARWPSTVCRFLTAGRAVVTTNVGDLSSVLTQHSAALVTEPSVAALVCGSLLLLDDDDRRMRIENDALRLADGALAWRHLAGRLEAFYGTLLTPTA